MGCTCTFIPSEILDQLANDPQLNTAERVGLAETQTIDAAVRKLRNTNAELTRTQANTPSLVALAAVAPIPRIEVYDCVTGMTLPGVPVPNPGASPDPTARRAHDETEQVAQFYQTLFGRNSIDDRGMTLVSSIHFGIGYNNAFWNGAQMAYGDGNGAIFIDFTLGQDVIAHELTHGVTQHSAGFAYKGEAGGLNESMSDVIGSMFRQWRNGQTVATADWLIGADILGPAAKAHGFNCLRNMKNPADPHCLGGAQPMNYTQYNAGMGPHRSSGIANHAFYLAATAIGGNSWPITGKIWYDALTAYGLKPGTKFKAFANRTRRSAQQLFPGQQAIFAAVHNAWQAVGL